MFAWWEYVYAYFVNIRMMSSGLGQVFGGFDRLSSISGSKIMAKMPQITQIPANPLQDSWNICFFLALKTRIRP